MSFFATSLIVLMGSASADGAAALVEPNPKAMSQAEIRAFNASLEKSHKFYIRCKRSTATGTLVQRDFSCRTNQQWAAADVRGNQEARDVGEEMASKSWRTSN